MNTTILKQRFGTQAKCIAYLEKLTSRNLLAMLKKIVKTDDSIVVSDDFKSYKSFDDVVEHITIKHKEGYGKGIRTVNTVEGFFSLIKNGINPDGKENTHENN